MLNIGRRYLNFWPVFWALFLLIIQVVTNLWLPTITADIINKGIAQSDMTYIWTMGAVMLAVALISWLSAIGNVYFASKQSQGLGKKLRGDLFKKILFMDERNFQDFGDATLITRTTNDVTQLQNVFQTMLRMMLMAPMMLIGSIFMAWHLSHDLMLVFVVALPVLALAVVINIAIAMPRFRSMQTKIDKINLIFQQGLTGERVIRAFNRDDYEIEKFDEANRDLTHTSRVVLTTIALLMPIMTVILSFTNIGIVWFGARLISQKMMEMGALVAFLTYATQILMSFMQLSAVAVMVPRAQVSAQRVREVLEKEDKIKDPNPTVAKERLPELSRHALQLEQVSFKFDAAAREVLTDLSVTVEQGETLAIIGGTGAGKTTLLHLIARLMDPTLGNIKLDGDDIRLLSQHVLRGIDTTKGSPVFRNSTL